MRSEIVADLDAIQPWRPAWDELAVELGRPFSSPAWTLSWWRHAAPAHAGLSVIAVWEGRELIAVAPLFVNVRAGLASYRLLAAPTTARVEPLARPGTEPEAATAFGRHLEAAEPYPDVVRFEGIPAGSMWPDLLVGAWPARRSPRVRRDLTMAAPTLSLDATSYEEWLGSRSAHWRREVRRRRRRLDEKGAVFRLSSTAADVRSELPRFAALHYARWSWRGGSSALDPGVENMLVAAAGELEGSDRFRLWTIEVDGKAISSQIFVGGGGELSYWLGGFDDGWAAYGPSTQAVLAAIEHAWTVGDDRVDFGAGGQQYKYDFATGGDVLEWTTVFPRTTRYPITRAQLLPGDLRRRLLATASQRISSGAKDTVKRILRRVRGS
jgi:CelD/BcsL family acetyltransferase involved in cellulose biosynthesis